MHERQPLSVRRLSEHRGRRARGERREGVMNPFSYASASRPEEAVAAVSRHRQAKFLAGGTTLVDLLRLEVETPDHLVHINALPLARIEPLPGGGVRIGAMRATAIWPTMPRSASAIRCSRRPCSRGPAR